MSTLEKLSGLEAFAKHYRELRDKNEFMVGRMPNRRIKDQQTIKSISYRNEMIVSVNMSFQAYYLQFGMLWG